MNSDLRDKICAAIAEQLRIISDSSAVRADKELAITCVNTLGALLCNVKEGRF